MNHSLVVTLRELDGNRKVYTYQSTTDALKRYMRLYELRATPRSIPLGIHKTHVSKTDSRGRHENTEAEFTFLLQFFPISYTEEWYLLTINQATNMDQKVRWKVFCEQTGEKISPYVFDRRSDRAYRDLHDKLYEHGVVTDD